MSNKFNVGDEIIIEEPTYRAGNTVRNEAVARVARKYFYVNDRFGNETGYEIDTGIEKPRNKDFTNYLGHAYTPSEYEDLKRRRAANGRWRDHRLSFNHASELRNKMSTEAMEQIANILDAETVRIS